MSILRQKKKNWMDGKTHLRFFLSPGFITSRLEWSVCQRQKLNVVKHFFFFFANRHRKSIIRRSQFSCHYTQRPAGKVPAPAADSLKQTQKRETPKLHRYKSPVRRNIWQNQNNNKKNNNNNRPRSDADTSSLRIRTVSVSTPQTRALHKNIYVSSLFSSHKGVRICSVCVLSRVRHRKILYILSRFVQLKTLPILLVLWEAVWRNPVKTLTSRWKRLSFVVFWSSFGIICSFTIYIHILQRALGSGPDLLTGHFLLEKSSVSTW